MSKPTIRDLLDRPKPKTLIVREIPGMGTVSGIFEFRPGVDFVPGSKTVFAGGDYVVESNEPFDGLLDGVGGRRVVLRRAER